VAAELDESLDLLGASIDSLPETARDTARAVMGQREELRRRIRSAKPSAIRGLKTRYHGDFHLGQVLLRRNDFVIVDFEGEPARPLAERRAKHSPLRDVAGMFRSFAYAREAAQQRCSGDSADDCATWSLLLESWERETRRIFFEVYDGLARTHGLYPSADCAIPLLELFEIEKALYELRYELRNRPQWVEIPLRGLMARDE
jgi:maltose alpha-D-glucosyltransferase/alpha-amylase